jgi:hypothetical protein
MSACPPEAPNLRTRAAGVCSWRRRVRQCSAGVSPWGWRVVLCACAASALCVVFELVAVCARKRRLSTRRVVCRAAAASGPSIPAHVVCARVCVVFVHHRARGVSRRLGLWRCICEGASLCASGGLHTAAALPIVVIMQCTTSQTVACACRRAAVEGTVAAAVEGSAPQNTARGCTTEWCDGDDSMSTQGAGTCCRSAAAAGSVRAALHPCNNI